MARRELLDDTPYYEGMFQGKMVTSVPGFLVGQHNYVELRNMRYMKGGFGVQTRNGMQRFNTTAVGSVSIDKIVQHFYNRAQTAYQDVYVVSDERKIYKGDAFPESSAGAGSLGSSLYTLAGSNIPSFAAVEDIAVFCGPGDLIAYSGSAPYCVAFYVGDDIDNSTAATAEDGKTFQIFTDEVTDEDTDTMATFTLDTLSTDNVNALYVGYWQPIDGITFDMGTSVNNNSAVLTVKYWNGSAWVDTSNDTGTTSGGAPFAIDGTIGWTYVTAGTEKPRRINGLTLFWYRIETDTLLDEVDVLKVTVTKDWRAIEDVTDGVRFAASGFQWYDATDTKYVDYGAEVASLSTATFARFTDATADQDLSSSDVMYVGFPIRIMGMRINIVSGYNNDGQASTLTVSYWDGTQWVAYAADEMDDGTSASSKTINQSGEIRLEDKGTSVRLTTIGDNKIPMFWYKLSFSAKLYNDANDEMRIYYIEGIPAPRILKDYSCCLNFKDRLFLFGREDAPNTGEYSAYKNPFMLSGQETSTVQPRVTFGDRDRINAAINYYNEALIFKRREVWMMEGDDPNTFGTLLLDSNVGCAAPETVKLVRMWQFSPDGRQIYQNVVLFQAYDGIYGCDGIKVFKISQDIDNYFDRSNSECIKDGYMDDSRAWYDWLRNEYHFIFYSGSTPTLMEFVYNTELQRWSGPWPRAMDVLCGLTVIGDSGEYLQYGGSDDGRLYQLECNSYTDVNSSNTSTAIDNYPILGDLWWELGNRWAFRRVSVYGVAQSSGSITISLAGDAAGSEVTLGTASMVKSGYGSFFDTVQFSDRDSGGSAMENKFQSARIKFRVNTVGVRQQLYGYRVERAKVGKAE